ncbi:glycoside hydrolase family 13 protein [Lacinutrix sp. C3R15]|uniref:glycoside hydrolase family 13 protein n=1 Tax=Flavobacteriaceae TaxID=49546 RepID=UPI001C0888ED|nr:MULTISPECIES: glycoside hydrolase family 13 protein [Flavobacteriaceae]MBU2939114.1 glycoside hydrolase family 13 protein [Lacinutrix sp. C3R15]MDO6622429.1 glycoside hydrolase family 13 protein [Oceanihabitans sp. 1_MG-2023]
MKQLKHILIFTWIIINVSCNENSKTRVSEVVTKVKNDIERVEPPNWWVGFKNTEVQLLVKHPNISDAKPSIHYEGVSITKVHKADSPNYLFLDLNISENTKAGQFNIHFKFNEEKDLVQTYKVKARVKEASDYQGFDSTDAIYLITPDRFANGDTFNDINESLKEKIINREDDYARHGGDLRGIIQHLDYIEDMGFTQIWPCPLLTNNMPESSYHGYAMTDFYQVDPRYGSLEEYQELATKAKEKGIGLIMDQVANHCGSNHWWMQDLPFKNWVNQQESFENNTPLNNSNHRRTSNQDLYASKRDKKEMAEGWFVSAMPDLNQRNPFMANYIIQNSIWWVETLNLSGIRQDTYPYPDKTFMSNWAGAIMNEYPNFSIVGEEWSTNPLLIAYWQNGHENKGGYQSNLKSTMDFAMQKNIVDAFNEEEKWDAGLVKIYEGLANDFAYASPKDILIFPDNHDMSRIFTQLKGDVINTKMALSYVLALPRIPQIYYGTEILMNDFKKPGDHGLIRTDFPGGWQGDTVNAFSGKGLTDAQKDMQSFLKKVLHYRKSSDAIHNGKTIHFAPFMGTYFLFRVIEGETVVHIINKNKEPITIDLKRYEEIGLNGKTLKNIITGETFIWQDKIVLPKKGSLLLTTKTN